jgi:hypothetical protein
MEEMPEDDASQQCPLCGHLGKISRYSLQEGTSTPESGSLAFHIECSECGTFDVSANLLEMVQGEQHWENTREKLRRAIRAKQAMGTKVLLLTRADIQGCIRDFEISNQ